MLLWLLCTTLAVVALLAIPLRVSIVASAAAPPRYRVHICWLFGLVQAPLDTQGAQATSTKRRSRRGTSTPGWSFKRTMSFVRAAGGPTRARQALDDLISSLHPQIERLQIGLGLDDPADTGRAFALLAPLSALLTLRYGQVQLLPCFTEAAFTVDGRAHFTVVPLQTLGVLLGYTLSFKTLHAFYIARAG